MIDELKRALLSAIGKDVGDSPYLICLSRRGDHYACVMSPDDALNFTGGYFSVQLDGYLKDGVLGGYFFEDHVLIHEDYLGRVPSTHKPHKLTDELAKRYAKHLKENAS